MRSEDETEHEARRLVPDEMKRLARDALDLVRVAETGSEWAPIIAAENLWLRFEDHERVETAAGILALMVARLLAERRGIPCQTSEEAKAG